MKLFEDFDAFIGVRKSINIDILNEKEMCW